MLSVLRNQLKCKTIKTMYVETTVTNQKYIYGYTMKIYPCCEILRSRFSDYEDFILLTVCAIVNVHSGIEALVCNQNIASCCGPDILLGLL